MILLEKIVFYLLVFCLPWQTRKVLYLWGGGFNEWTSAYLYLTDILVILLFCFWALRKRRKRFLKEFKIFKLKDSGFWLVAFLFFSSVTLIQARNLPLGFYAWFKLLEFVILFFYCKQNYKEIFNFKRVAQVFVASGVFQSLIAISQFVSQKSLGLRLLTESPLGPAIDGVAKFTANGLTFIRAYGSLPHPNLLAVYLLTCLFFVYYLWFEKKRNFRGNCFLSFIYILLLLALFLTFSRMIIFVFFLASLIFFILIFKKHKKKALNLFLLLIVSSFIFFLIAQPEISARFQIFSGEQAVGLRLFYNQVAYDTIQQYPWLGIGLGNFVWEIKDIFNLFSNWLHQPVHNVYLLIASEVGLIGLIIFLMFIYQLLVQNKDKLLLIIILSFLFIALFDHFFWTLQQGQLILWLVLGLTAGQRGV